MWRVPGCIRMDLTGAHSVDNLRACVQDIKRVNELHAYVHARMGEKFDSGEASHEGVLEELWSLLQPGRPREGGRFTKEWGRIGFQQADPASDFRGGGMLALDQLVHMAGRRTAIAQRMLTEPHDDMARYPWACVGINLTMEVVRILDDRLLDHRLYGKDLEQGLAVLHDVYADIFEVLHARWLQAEPENVLAFPGVLKLTMEFVQKELADGGGVLVPPGAQA